MTSIYSGIYITMSVFILGEPKHKCSLPGYNNDSYNIQSDFHTELVDMYIPLPTEKKKDYEDCHVYQTNISTYISHNHTRIGRKKAIQLSFILVTATAISLAFSPNYIVFVILYFLLGAANAGVFTTRFVIGLELVGPTKRKFVGIATNYFFAIGLLVLAGVGYLLRDWQYILLALSAPTVLLIPESPRWLLSQGRITEANEIVRKAAKVNKVTLPEKIFDKSEAETPANNMLSMTYYGLSLNTGNLGGNFFLNLAISGLVEIPAYTLAILFLDRLGRKKCHSFSMILGGAACLSTIFSITYGGESLQGVTTALAMIGKLGSSAAFSIIYVFSAELFPTVVRNAGIGASSCCARIGVMAAPYIVDSTKMIKSDFGQSVPLVVFGAASVFAGLLSLLLPETLGQHLPETLEDGKLFGTKEYQTLKEKQQNVFSISDTDNVITVTKL
ncbi:hypothetical protein KUTeg_005729 [Tegillarca granosa]|uniref:Uncharacterized protein n=1 Tax=Tegillarca granosa TaxID=220873 RepID=A0ABQ9FHF5_TEGGR|nr:hypothetical protein KUTeg_005729 [Tegillarca granosa]